MALNEKIQQVRKQLVDDVISAMEQGVGQWERTWKTMRDTMPQNAITGKRYRGGNAFSLAFHGSRTEDPTDNRWCTFKQAQEKGWSIKKGSKGQHISYFEIKETEKMNPETKQMEPESTAIIKSYVVFHASQIEGIPKLEKAEPEPFQKIEKAERILRESGAVIKHGGNRAFYSVNKDYIQMPEPQAFKDPEFYYATALHELGHWTGHESRLSREFAIGKQTQKYAREELVAEMTSMFTGAETGMLPDKEHFEQHAKYLNSWVSALKKDHNELFRAAAEADKASNLILQHEHRREREQQQNDKNSQEYPGKTALRDIINTNKGERLHVMTSSIYNKTLQRIEFYETGVFHGSVIDSNKPDFGREIHQRQYTSQEEAERGHTEMMAKVIAERGGKAAESKIQKKQEQPAQQKEKAPSLEQEIKGMKLLEGEGVKVYTNPSAQGNYKGDILHVDKNRGICVQQVGKNSLVAHQLDKLERIPEKGESLRITYKENEKAKVATQQREQGRGR